MEERRNRPEFENSIKKWRYNFSKSFFTFWKNIKMFGPENERIVDEIKFFREVLNFFFAEKNEFSILFDGIDIKVDKVRIRGQRQDDKYFEDIYDLFLSLCMSGVVFKKGVTDDEIVTLMRTIGKFPIGREPKIVYFERVKAELPPLQYIDIFPYDPEESGNLPIYTAKQSIRRNFISMVTSFGDYEKMVSAAESIPLRMIERSVQDLMMIALNAKKAETIDFMVYLSSLHTVMGSFAGTSAASRAFLAILVALRMRLDLQAVKRVGISAYFQYFSEDKMAGYSALSRMDEFNYDRIEAALNCGFRAEDFREIAISDPDASSGTPSGDILKAVSYFDAVTKADPKGDPKRPSLTRHQALRMLMKNSGTAFRREVVESMIAILGIYPVGSILKIGSTNELCVAITKIKTLFKPADVLVLDKNLSVTERRNVGADELLDVFNAAGAVLPETTQLQILFHFLDEREKEN